jgi:hypothetical protein
MYNDSLDVAEALNCSFSSRVTCFDNDNPSRLPCDTHP